MPPKESLLEDEPLWYKDAVIYELYIKAFNDSNGDGSGDLKGLIEKLDYLKDMGITAVWILPFYPSPLKDGGYDISDYFNVHSTYGTLRDFREFMRAAHKRGIRVITELVLNHTSDQHAWFQKSRRAETGTILRDYYVWSDSPEKYKDARIIFKDFEKSNWEWDHIAKSYYWHRFYSHQPDLNFDNPHVQKAMFRVINFWLKMGVDGMRLDAVPYLYERDNTNCENLAETFEFLKKLRQHVDGRYKNKMLLAEANQWPEDAVNYFGNGDECHMAFHFPLMPRVFMSLWMEDRYPILDIFEQTPDIPQSCQWAIFLRNHDELTLEMVTDEERDYMYRVYAQDPTARINLGIRRRLAPLLGNHRRKIELMNFLLFSLPGTPVIYYGDEIGMGDNYYLGDRNGVRTPMQWSAGRNAGFSRANPQKLYLPVIIDPEYHYESVNVENQERNQSSLFWWMKRIISMRKRFKAFGRGTIEFLLSDNPKVLTFIRQYEQETILVIVNLSRFAQPVELDLSRFAGFTPEEVFSGNKFPVIRDTPYILTLGFLDYFWFSLKKEGEKILLNDLLSRIPELKVKGNWVRPFSDKTGEKLENEILPSFLKGCRWFAGKARQIRQIRIIENIPVGRDRSGTYLLFIKVFYIEGLPEIYLLPLAFAAGDEAKKIIDLGSSVIVSRLSTETEEGVLYDGTYSEDFQKDLLRLISRRQGVRGQYGQLSAYPGRFFKTIKDEQLFLEKSHVLKAEQTNTSILYGHKLFLKLIRRPDEGLNPDLEIGRFLTEKTQFSKIAPFTGAIEYKGPEGELRVVAILQGFVPNEGDGWKYTLDSVERYFERALSRRLEIQDVIKTPRPVLVPMDIQKIPAIFKELIGVDYLEMISVLGKRTAELHLALSSDREDPDFAPEPFSLLYQRSVYQSMQSFTKRIFTLLRKNIKNLQDTAKEKAIHVLGLEKNIMDQYKGLLKKKIPAMKIRIHGDYHLGQVLYKGNDFIIIDFEGEPERPLSERRLKRSPAVDVAGMIRSFHYAASSALFKHTLSCSWDGIDTELLVEMWYGYVSNVFLHAYLEAIKVSDLLPRDMEELSTLFTVFLLEKAVYEIGYELNNRPEWVMIPINGITHLL